MLQATDRIRIRFRDSSRTACSVSFLLEDESDTSPTFTFHWYRGPSTFPWSRVTGAPCPEWEISSDCPCSEVRTSGLEAATGVVRG